MNPMLWSFQAPSRINLFFAFRPPPEFCPAIESLGGTILSAHRLRGKLISGERLHNTLASVYLPCCDIEEAIVRAHNVGARIKHSPFRARFESTQSFDVHRNRYPLVLRGDLEPLTGFHRALARQMAQEDLPVPGSYTPHITLLWADRLVEEYPIAPIEWVVTEFVLVASFVGQSRHIILDHWQLA